SGLGADIETAIDLGLPGPRIVEDAARIVGVVRRTGIGPTALVGTLLRRSGFLAAHRQLALVIVPIFLEPALLDAETVLRLLCRLSEPLAFEVVALLACVELALLVFAGLLGLLLSALLLALVLQVLDRLQSAFADGAPSVRGPRGERAEAGDGERRP